MTAPLTLEPLSRAHLPEMSALWADPAVIRYTNIAAPCTAAESADRLDCLLDCQRGLPSPAIFAVWEEAAFRGLAGCPPVDTAAGTYGLFYQLLPSCWGRGLGLAAAQTALRQLEKLTPVSGAGGHCGGKCRQHPHFDAAGLCPDRRPSGRPLPGGAEAGHLGLCPPPGQGVGHPLAGPGAAARRPAHLGEMRNDHERKTAAVRL